MPKLRFSLPHTNLCTVVWYRNGQKQETLIATPKNNSDLALVMLKHKVGASEIRTVKAVSGSDIAQAMQL